MTSNRYLVLFMCLVGATVTAGQGCGGSSPGTADGSPPGNDGSIPAQGGGGSAGQGGGGALGQGGGPGGAGGGSGGTGPTCGQAGASCCDGNACVNGGCCVAGICMLAGGTCVGLGDGICADGVCGNCGGPGLPCCGANPATGVCTASGTACSSGTCTQCGNLGQPCCAGASGGTGKCTGANAICSNNVCLVCGTPGAACCPGNLCNSAGCCYDNVCAGEGTACRPSGGTCLAGRCSACGSANQPCCINMCYDGLLCKNAACVACGGMGQACCPAGTATAACQDGSTCTSDGVCARCGSLGDVCCAGNTCSAGCCIDGRCLDSSACVGPPDGGGSPDAPLGGSGSGGAGGSGGTTTGSGGIVGSGGATTTVPTGGSGGTTTPWTVPVGCGDGVVTSPERCDDGNNLPFDGCSSDCQPEPDCSGSSCASKCGDGLVVGEECDDGNAADGDGCSSSCTVEPGFTCTQPPLGDRILVPVVYRDFKFHNPTDFEAGVTGSEKASPGVVNLELDSDGKPVFSGLTGSAIHVASQTTFATWYRDTSGVNHATPSKLALWTSGNGSYVNRYGEDGARWPITKHAYWCGYVGSEVRDGNGDAIPCTYQTDAGVYQTDCDKLIAQGGELLTCKTSGGSYEAEIVIGWADGTPVFFPVDDDTFSSSEKTGAQIPEGIYEPNGLWPWDVDAAGAKILHNFSFTSEIRYWFKYEAGQSYRLDITGDDDVWVFVNKQLAVDLGGIHTPVEGSVTLDDTTATKFGLTAGKVYEVAVFQAERQSTSSTFRITLTGFNAAPSECRVN